MKEQSHNHGHHHGIHEQNGAGDACIHVVVAEKKEKATGREKQAEGHQGHHLATAHTHGHTLQAKHDTQHENGKQIAEEEHAVHHHATLVERKGEQWIESIAGSSYGPHRKTFYLW